MRERLQRLLPVTKKMLAVMVLLFAFGSTSRAQFNPAAFPEYPYPTPGTIIPGPWPNPVNVTTHTFDYSMGHISYMTPFGMNTPPPLPGPPFPQMAPMSTTMSDLLVHSWDDPGSSAGIAWINKANGSGTPGTIYDQGFIMYPKGVQNIEMSLQQDSMGYAMWIWGTTGTWYVVVSYYNSIAGPIGPVGHYVDVYQWNRPVPVGIGGLTLVSRQQLSKIPNFTRISQDGHNTYGFAITWENPIPGNLAGIDFVYGFMNNTIAGPSISPVTVLCGTRGETHPDVAFTHTGNGLKLQFVYYTLLGVGGGVRITESETPFVLGPPWGPVTICPAINDVNILPGPYFATPDLKTRIDAPDHGMPDNWAYSYLDLMQPNDVFVRFNNLSVFTTYNVTGSTLAPPPAALKLNDWPVCSFDQNTANLNVGWYTQDGSASSFYAPNIGGYVDVQMDQTGALVTPTDYMQVGTAATLSNQQASYTPSIAYSRQNDRTDYHYLVFANAMNCPNWGVPGQIQTKARDWTSPAFKGASEQNGAEELYAAGKPAQNATGNIAVPRKQENMVTAYPNPFNDKLSLNISVGLLDQQLEVRITDITGKEIDKFTEAGKDVNARLANLSGKLSNGSYMVTVSTTGGDYSKTLKVQKLEH